MKTLFWILFAIMNFHILLGQDTLIEFIELGDELMDTSNLDFGLQEMPKFNGTDDINGIKKFIEDNLALPQLHNCFVTRIYVTIEIDTSGYISKKEIKIDDNRIHCENQYKDQVKDAYKNAIIDVLEKMPKFEPGKVGDEKKSVRLTFPINIDYDF